VIKNLQCRLEHSATKMRPALFPVPEELAKKPAVLAAGLRPQRVRPTDFAAFDRAEKRHRRAYATEADALGYDDVRYGWLSTTTSGARTSDVRQVSPPFGRASAASRRNEDASSRRPTDEILNTPLPRRETKRSFGRKAAERSASNFKPAGSTSPTILRARPWAERHTPHER